MAWPILAANRGGHRASHGPDDGAVPRAGASRVGFLGAPLTTLLPPIHAVRFG